MKKKNIIIIVLLAIIVLGFVFQDSLVQTYVKICHENLETFSDELLNRGSVQNTSYGLWDVTGWADDNMVEFITGGSGLAPSSTYKGFYYSPDNTHKPFQGADVPMDVDGENATWTDGTDNHGHSVRIMDNWFWFEASF